MDSGYYFTSKLATLYQIIKSQSRFKVLDNHTRLAQIVKSVELGRRVSLDEVGGARRHGRRRGLGRRLGVGRRRRAVQEQRAQPRRAPRRGRRLVRPAGRARAVAGRHVRRHLQPQRARRRRRAAAQRPRQRRQRRRARLRRLRPRRQRRVACAHRVHLSITQTRDDNISTVFTRYINRRKEK